VSHRQHRFRLLALIVSVVALGSLGLAGGAARASGPGPDLPAVQLTLAPFASGLSNPLAMTWRHGDARMYVAEQTGSVVILDATGNVVSPPVLTLTDLGTGGEQGLLGIAFSPDGTKLYVDYVNTVPQIKVVEYTMNGDVADTSTARELLSIDHPMENHNGGELAIGPDGDLYLGVGDGGGSGDPDGNGQNVDVLLGKILRIDPTPSGSLPYTIPSDNPFVGQAHHRAEIWMYGLRNPWRFTFDRATGQQWIADVGQDSYEEVDLAAPGQRGTNFGWNLREGFHPYNGGAKPPGEQDPLFELAHTDGYCAIIGGYVYRGSAIANLNGAYLYSDLCKGHIEAYANGQTRVFDATASSPTAFGEDPNGELYISALDGTIQELVPAGPAPTVSIGDVSMLEGNTGTRKATFTVTLSQAAAKTTSVHYAIVGASATASKKKGAGVDLHAATGTVSLKKGTVTKTVTVAIYGDTAPEPDETYEVTLSSPNNGYSLGRASGTGTILDDDPGAAALGVGDVTIVRSGGGTQQLIVPVTLSAAAPKSFVVSYAITPGSATYNASADGVADFGGALTGTLQFGRTTYMKSISVPVWPKGDTEGDKSFTVAITVVNPDVAVTRATGTETITDP